MVPFTLDIDCVIVGHEPITSFEDEVDIEALREELRLARALITLQASKIHSLQAAARPARRQSPRNDRAESTGPASFMWGFRQVW
jgi:hypothetical protein